MRTSRPYIPVCPILESSQPQFSKSPILQFLVSVYMTPAALMACTKDVSLVAVRSVKECEHQCYIQPRFLIHSGSISVQRGHYSSVRKLRVKSLRVKTATVSLKDKPFPRSIPITLLLSYICYILYVLPLRRPLCVDNWSVFSGQFHLSHANWCLHSCIPLCAPVCTLLT